MNGHARDVFAVNQRGAAVERLYERYAELLPDGPARQRDAATARGPFILGRRTTA